MESINDFQASLVAIIDENNNFKGSGFIIGSDGYVITCHHVIFTLISIRVKYGNDVYNAEWVGEYSMPNHDIAILKVENLSIIKSQRIIFEPKEGEECYLLGYTINSNDNIYYPLTRFGVVRKDVDVDVNATLVGIDNGDVNVFQNRWNSMPDNGSMYKSYKVNCSVDMGFSGGLAIGSDSCGIIGIIQSSSESDTMVIRWENILSVLDYLNINIVNIKQRFFNISKYVINRSEKIDEIRGRIINGMQGQESNVIILCGFGGYGKTLLAKCMCNDRGVRRVFRDGICYGWFGRENTDDQSIANLLKDIIRQISNSHEESNSVEYLGERLKDIIGDKYVLIYLDDVWTGLQLKPFLSGCRNCVILVTTRNKKLLRYAENNIEIHGLSPGQAYELLTCNIEKYIGGDEKVLLERLCKEFSYWPQMLSIVNGWLYGCIIVHNQSVIDAINSLKKSLENKGFTAFDPDEECEVTRENTIRVCVEVSLEDIGENKERLYELAVFYGNNEIPFDLVSMLWNKTARMTEEESIELCKKFYNKSLISSFLENDRNIVLHDNILNYIYSAIKSDAQYMRKINGILVDGLCRKYGDDLLGVPEKELYIWGNILKYHVRSGGNKKALLLLKNYLWLAKKISVFGIHGLLDDFKVVALDDVASRIYNALLLSKNILVEYPNELPEQLWGRLAYDKSEGIKLFLLNVERDVDKRHIRMAFPSLTPSGLEKFKLVGHGGAVNSSQYCSLDESRSIITSSDDNTIRIWDATFGLYKNELIGHTDRVTVALCSNDEYAILSGSDDYTVNVFNILTGEVKRLSCHSDVINAVKMAKYSDRVITASADGSSYVWSTKQGEIIWQLDDRVISVNDVCISNDETIVVTVSSDNNGRVWSMNNGSLIFKLSGHTDSVKKVVITPDNRKIITVSNDSTVRIWCAINGRQLNVFTQHKKAVNFVDCSLKGNYFVTSSDDNTAILWDLKKGGVKKILKTHLYPVNVVRFSRDEKLIITASSDNTACLWNAKNGRKCSVLTGHIGEILDANFSDDASSVVTASSDASARVWFSKKTNHPRRIKLFHNKRINYLCFSGQRKLIASASDDKDMKIWDLVTGELVSTITGHKYGVNIVVFSPDSKFIATASADNSVILWCAETYKRKSVNPIVHKANVNYICFSPDSRKLVSASDDKTAIIKSINGEVDDIVLDDHNSFVNFCIFSPDGRHVLTTSGDSLIRIWSSTENSKPIILEGHKKWISLVKYSSNGDMIMTASGDGTIRVWDVRNDYKVSVISFSDLFDDQYEVYQSVTADISDDLHYVYVVVRCGYYESDYNWGVVVWDLKKNKYVSSPLKKGYVIGASFIANHLKILLIMNDYSLRCYDIDNNCEISCLHFDYQPSVISVYDEYLAVGDEYGRVHICVDKQYNKNQC
jgi:WD40 repeat protein